MSTLDLGRQRTAVEQVQWLVVQGCCVWAVYHGSHLALRKWIAVQALSPPELGPELEPAPTPIAEEPIRELSGIRWLFSRRNIEPLWPIFIGLAPYSLIWFIVSQLKTQFLLDGGHIAFIWACISVLTTCCFSCIPIKGSKLSLVPSGPGRRYMLNQHNPRQTWHWVAPPLVVALSVFAAAHGVPQIAAAIRVFLICSFLVAVTGPPMALRIPLVLFNVAFVLTPALLFVKDSFYPTSTVIQLNEDGPIALGPDAIKVSPWITAYNADVYLFIFYVFVGYPLAMALRYDYVHSNLSSPSLTEPGELALIPVRTPRFAKPIFHAGLVGLISSPIAGMLLRPYMSPSETYCDMGVLYTGVLAVSGCMVLRATVRGEFKRFWMYYEQWSPVAGEVDERPQGVDMNKTMQVPDEVGNEGNEENGRL